MRRRIRVRQLNGAPGVPVDSDGGPTIDPTRNVIDLVYQGNERQDDLRDLTNLLYDEKVLRLEDMAKLRDAFAKEIRELETKRLDAVRQVDVGQASTTAAALLTAVQTLSGQTGQRDEVTNKRIAALEQSLAKGEGKATVSDPALEKLLVSVDQLISAGNRSTGKDAGVSWVGALVVGVMTVIATGLGVYALVKP